MALILAEIALGLLAVYFMNDYYIVGLLVLFIILFPIVTKSSSGGVCPKLDSYTIAGWEGTVKFESNGLKVTTDGQDYLPASLLIPTKNIIGINKVGTYTFKVEGGSYTAVPPTSFLGIINCSGIDLKVSNFIYNGISYSGDFTVSHNNIYIEYTQEDINSNMTPLPINTLTFTVIAA